jgi:hypothetical protein
LPEPSLSWEGLETDIFACVFSSTCRAPLPSSPRLVQDFVQHMHEACQLLFR